jgi:hypothetical protein
MTTVYPNGERFNRRKTVDPRKFAENFLAGGGDSHLSAMDQRPMPKMPRVFIAMHGSGT